MALLESLQPLFLLGKMRHLSVLGCADELVPYMADCSVCAENMRQHSLLFWSPWDMPNGVCPPFLLVSPQHNFRTEILPTSAEAKKTE